MDEPAETVPSSSVEAETAPVVSLASDAPSPGESSAAVDPPSQGGSRSWSGIALFLLGVLAGVLGFALVARLTTTPAPDSAAVRDAARAGTLDAIATLQAGGPAAAQSNATPTPAVVDVAFDLRAANRTGNPDAPVTIVEFSDFQ